MNNDLKQKIHNSPLKKKFIAEHIGVNPTVLSMCLKGERHLDTDKEDKLKKLLEKTSW